MSNLRTSMGISSIKDVIRYNHLCHLVISNAWMKKNGPKILNFEVNGNYPGSCPEKKWFNNIRSYLDKLQLSTSLAQDRSKWRNAIKPSRHIAESNPRCWGKEGQ